MKNINKISILFLGLVLAIPSMAGKERGGGDVYACPKAEKDGGGYTYHIADLFFESKYRLEKWQLSKYSSDDIIFKTLETLAESPEINAESLSFDLAIRLGDLTFKKTKKVPEVDDDDLPNVVDGCKKMQAMAQDLDTGVVLYSPKIWRHLDSLDRAYLKLHEAWISIFHNIAMKDAGSTKPIRDKLHRLFMRTWFPPVTQDFNAEMPSLKDF